MADITKVVKLPLKCEHYDKYNNHVYYKDIYKILWDLQKQTREIKNKSIQYCWEYNNFSSDYYKINQEYPKEKDILSYTLSGFVNDKFKIGNDLYSSNCSTTVRNTCSEFNNSKKEIINGTKSIINYKANQPLDLHNKAITLYTKEKYYYVALNLLNRQATKKYNFKNTKIIFKIDANDKSSKTILERCINNTYSIGASKLIYDKKKKSWVLNLSYKFKAGNTNDLDINKILGVDLGIHFPICASVFGEKKRFTIEGGEITNFRKQVEARKHSLQKQGKYCGNGRIGHGINTRNKPVYKIEDKIARFRDTANHKYSRALIDYAVKNHCGVIQMEDLTGITDFSERFLKNWSYFDLQTKIEYKAKEAGIKVVYINPKYTSQRCSLCGYISSENRKTQERFYCQKCKFKENADYNASQNIGIKNIDILISENK